MIGAVPKPRKSSRWEAGRVRPLGLELRGGTLARCANRRGDLEPAARERGSCRRESRPGPIARRLSPPPTSMSSRCTRWSPRAIPRSESRPIAAMQPPIAIAPVVFNGRIDPPGEDDRFVIATTPGPAAANQGGSFGIRLGTRRRPSSAWQERGSHRQRRRYQHRLTRPTGPAGTDARHRRPVARAHRSRRHQRDHAC